MQVMTANTVAAQPVRQHTAPPVQTTQYTPVTPGFDSLKGFEVLQRIGNMFSQSNMIPESFRGNIGNCCIAIEMAHRLGASPLMVMQNLYIVYGNPAWSSKFMIATFNQCGRFEPIHYREVGKKGSDDWGMQALSADLRSGQVLEGPVVTIGMAKQEGWYQKKGSKWPTMPELMLRYRAAAFFIRTTAPEISMGLMTREEVEDEQTAEEKKVDIPTAEIKAKANKKTIDVAAVSVEKAPVHKEHTAEDKKMSQPVQQQKTIVKEEQTPPQKQTAKEQTHEDTELFGNPDDVPSWMA